MKSRHGDISDLNILLKITLAIITTYKTHFQQQKEMKILKHEMKNKYTGHIQKCINLIDNKYTTVSISHNLIIMWDHILKMNQGSL